MNAGGGPEDPRRPDDQRRHERQPDDAREAGDRTPGDQGHDPANMLLPDIQDTRAYGQGSHGQGSHGQGSDLQGAYGQGSYGQGSDLQGAYGQGSYGQGSDLQGAYGQGSYGRGPYGPALSAYDPRQQGQGHSPYRPHQSSHADYIRRGHGAYGGDDRPGYGYATPSGTLPQTPTATLDPSSPPAGGDRRRPRGRRWTLLVALVVVVVVLAGGGAGTYVVLSGEESGTALSLHNQGTRVGDAAFAPGAPAAGDGVSEPLNDVAAVGRTVVAVGNVRDGNVGSGLFLVSTNGGARWQVADVEAADGGPPPPWEFPDHVVGAEGAWLALGRTGATSAVWTSEDGRTWTWTHLGDAAAEAFAPGDHVGDLARGSAGYIAAGYTARDGRHAPVMWTSKSGQSWRRIGPRELRLPRHVRVDEFQRVVARGRVILAKAVSRTPGKAVLLRSGDGGRTWRRVTLPKVKGSRDPVGVLASTGRSFVAVVDGVAKKRLTPVSVVLSSADGRRWKRRGTIHPGRGKKHVTSEAVVAAKHRLAVLATVGHTYAMFTSRRGGRWSRPVRVGSLDTVRLTALSAVGGSVVAVGSTLGPDTDPVAVRVAGGHAKTVDLSTVPGVQRVRHVVNAVAAGQRSAVAVGGVGGGAAIWTSTKGGSWERARTAPGVLTGPRGSHTGELLDVVRGTDGWVAAGVSESGVDRTPLVVTSRDGVLWRSVAGQPAFAVHVGGEHRPRRLVPRAVAYGPSGYVIVGYVSREPGTFSGAAWHSRGLGGWRRGTGAAAHDLSATSRVSRKMLDVTGGSFGYAAAGLTASGADVAPAVWTSKNGSRWALRRVRVPRPGDSGRLREIASRGDTIVALGMATVTGRPHDPEDDKAFPFATVSHDGGRTWRTGRLPRVKGRAYVTALTAAKDAFVAVGVAGEPGRGDVVAWYSADGRSWRTATPKGSGLSGRGKQRLGGVTARGDQVIGVGYSADDRQDVAVLWQARLVS